MRIEVATNYPWVGESHWQFRALAMPIRMSRSNQSRVLRTGVPFSQTGDIQGDAIDYEDTKTIASGDERLVHVPDSQKTQILLASIGGIDSERSSPSWSREESCNQHVDALRPIPEWIDYASVLRKYAQSTSNRAMNRRPSRFRISKSQVGNASDSHPAPRRTTPDRGESGRTDGVGGRAGNPARHLPPHRHRPARRRGPPTHPPELTPCPR